MRTFISVFLAGTFGVLLCGCMTGAGGGAGGGNGGDDNGDVGSRLLFSDLNAALMSISGTSSSDVYAVGADPDDGLGPYVLHYNGSNWRRLESGAEGDLWWISVTPIDGDFFMAGTGGKVLRLDPPSGQFTQFETPGSDVDTVFGVWGPDGDNVWAVGGDLEEQDTSGFIWRFDGSEWTEQDVSEAVPEGLPILYKVRGRSDSDVYAVGRLGIILHFDGADWSRIATDTTRTLFTVHGNAEQVVAVGGFIDAVILERDGDSFVDQAAPATPQLNGVFVPDTGGAVAVGIEGALGRRTDGGWAVSSESFDITQDFHSTWVDPNGGVWAVGGNLSSDLNEGLVAYSGTETINTTVVP